jgi:hypothetical protein
MEKAFTVQLVNYAPILKSAGIRYKEDEKTLMVGKASSGSGFVILISCRTLDAPKLLQVILPILKNSKAAYRIIKSQNDQYRLNAGAYGEDEAGKVMSIFPKDLTEAKQLAGQLCQSTANFKGPLVMNAQRIGEVVYIQKVELMADRDFKLSSPDLKYFPFEFNKSYKLKKSRLGLIGRYYLPVQLLRSSSKGNIYKAINLKRFAFDWCLIKQGNPVALDDHFDRDMKDRLLWQKEVHEALKNKVYIPEVIDFFSIRDYHYLVLNYAQGDSLGDIVRDQLAGNQWLEINSERQIQLLTYFIQAAEIVKTIHEAGFVHRDVTDSNFILLDDGKLCVIDFELSYSLKLGLPNPPFLLGTFGYVAPEQIRHAIPDQKEDIYSLGALLCFVITACKTWEFIIPNHQQLKAKLMRVTDERELTNVIMRCLSNSRAERPTIDELIGIVQNRLVTKKHLNHEKIAMAV